MLQKTFSVKNIDSFLTQTFNIHRPTADKMLHLSDDLGGATFVVRAIMDSLPFFPDQGTAAFGTAMGIDHRFGPSHAPGSIYSNDLGNDLSAFFYQNGITLMKIQADYFISIMEGCPLNRSSCKQYGFQVSHGSHRPGTSYLVAYLPECGLNFTSLIFVGNSPARGFCSKA